jgi:hypothetical protein
MGVQLDSRGFDQLMAQEKAKKRRAQQIFCGQEYGSVCENRYNYCNASVPHPLPIVLAPREVEYVEENEPVRPTRDMDVSPNEVCQYSERHDCSRKTPRAAHRDVPDGFYKPMASHMVQMAGDAD